MAQSSTQPRRPWAPGGRRGVGHDRTPSPREDLALTTKSGFSQPRPKGPCLGSPGHGAVPTAPSDSSPGARASPSSSPRVLRRAWPARSSVCRHAAENRIHTRGDRPHQLVLPGPALPTGPMSQDPGSWRSPPRSPAGLGRQVVGAALATTEPRPREDLALTTKSGFSQPRPKGPCLGSPGHGAVPTRSLGEEGFRVGRDLTRRPRLAWVNDENSYGLEER
ncbi:translation initiation factor IF-2-like [Mustela putorius furo]|uniref:Translation initiation factor IF-2-like n=1 Tax=Mustela putorius furo TaxID=9669 RepID=A0A8U0USB5_MUSPF|nr:translation initiation factor IF-2-like [Mustela putorius furo]